MYRVRLGAAGFRRRMQAGFHLSSVMKPFSASGRRMSPLALASPAAGSRAYSRGVMAGDDSTILADHRASVDGVACSRELVQYECIVVGYSLLVLECSAA